MNDTSINPYESPQDEPQPNRPTENVGRLPRVLAVVCWMLAAVPLLVVVVVSLIPDGPPNDPAPWWAFPLACTAFGVLPSLGFALVGFANWRNSWSLFTYGIASFLLSGVAFLALAILD